LDVVGSVYRIYKPRQNLYTDEYIDAWLTYNNDTDKYLDYYVIGKNTTISRKSISRFNKPQNPFTQADEQLYRLCAQSLPREFRCIGDSRLMSYDEVLSKYDSTKSPGYPWTLLYPIKYDYWMSDNLEHYDRYWSALATDTPLKTLTSVSCKEEIRSADKIRLDKGRTIFAVDVNHLVASGVLMMDQNEKLIRSNLECASALGLTLYHGGTQRLANYLMKWGNIANMFSVDGKEFDSTYNNVAFEEVYRFRFQMLRHDLRHDDNWRRFWNLMLQIRETFLVDIDGVLYWKKTGNCSGQGNTTPDNIFKAFLDGFCLWCMCAPLELQTWHAYSENVRTVHCGDDWIFSVNPEYLEVFNFNTIQANAPRLGITLEFENKEPELFQNLTFIGHRFKLVEVPRTNLKVWVSDIDCRKMRCSMVHGFSENSVKGTIHSALERACGIRNETFMCVSCRTWFSSIICFLMDKIRDDNSERAKAVRSCYLTDDQLWQIHTGLTNWEVKKLGDIFNSTTDPSSQAPLNKFEECRKLLIQSKILRS
jgi:hypothetical protein